MGEKSIKNPQNTNMGNFKRKQWVILASLVLCGMPLSATKIVLLSADGDEKTVELTTVQNVSIVHDVNSLSMSANMKDGERVDQIKTLVFSDKSELSYVSATSANGMNLYPNPVTELLIISGVEDNLPVTITDMSGCVVKCVIGNRIDVSSLPDGMYIVGVDGKYAKFNKKSK
ncbi:MAG: T9SS type A sorting domain-containing protein [Paludibacteraceae bacterium]|nr:T9SS type A sorting domain-containing protein [Paludibacteraceae bacterium]